MTNHNRTNARQQAAHATETLLAHSRNQGITDVQLAEMSGVPRASIAKLRNSLKATFLDEFLAICDALDVEPEHAIQGHPEGIPPQTITIGGRTYRLEEDGE